MIHASSKMPEREDDELRRMAAAMDRLFFRRCLAGLKSMPLMTQLPWPALTTTTHIVDRLDRCKRRQARIVSHFGMLMTGWMNRYLVLMKFRDGTVARRRRKEWDRKVFNSMEVSLVNPLK